MSALFRATIFHKSNLPAKITQRYDFVAVFRLAVETTNTSNKVINTFRRHVFVH